MFKLGGAMEIHYGKPGLHCTTKLEHCKRGESHQVELVTDDMGGTAVDQANPQARQEGDKLLILLADRLSMVEHHQPAWTSLQIESSPHFIESSFVQFCQLRHLIEHLC